MNPLYQMLNQQSAPMPQNPMQRFGQVMQAMRNPVQFIRQAFPDIPNEISGNPNQILAYLQKTRGISNEQIQSLMNQLPRF